ncbi:MAG: hypothetical protein ACPGN3_04240 [Opitutales bacterium]
MNEKSDRTRLELSKPIRTYNRQLFTAQTQLSCAAMIICAVVIISSIPLNWSPLLIIATVIAFCATIVFQINHIQGPRKIELYDEGLALIKPRSRTFLKFTDIERLHYDQADKKLKIETKNGEFHRIEHLAGGARRLRDRLEDAVYGAAQS